jgi:hypothetical protein
MRAQQLCGLTSVVDRRSYLVSIDLGKQGGRAAEVVVVESRLDLHAELAKLFTKTPICYWPF